MGGSNSKTTSAPTLSRSQFVRVADRACQRDHEANKAIAKPTSLAALVRDLQRAIPSLEHEIVSLRRLDPPHEDAALFARVLNDLDAQDIAGTHLVAAIQAGQEGPSKRLARQIDALDKHLRSLDRRLGLRACVRDA